jgi:hypothetical protein
VRDWASCRRDSGEGSLGAEEDGGLEEEILEIGRLEEETEEEGPGCGGGGARDDVDILIAFAMCA